MKLLIIDTETTGLPKSHLAPLSLQPRIIEYCGMVIDERGNFLQSREYLINPRIKLPPEIIRITGIKDDDLIDKPEWKAVHEKIKAQIEGADAVIAHNLPFDQTMVNIECQHLNDEVKWPSRQICTVEQTTHLFGRRLKLNELHEHLFGEPHKNAHRARNDVTALCKIVVELIKQKILIPSP